MAAPRLHLRAHDPASAAGRWSTKREAIEKTALMQTTMRLPLISCGIRTGSVQSNVARCCRGGLRLCGHVGSSRARYRFPVVWDLKCGL